MKITTAICVKEEMLKGKSSGMNKRCDVVDPILPKDKEMIDFVHDSW